MYVCVHVHMCVRLYLCMYVCYAHMQGLVGVGDQGDEHGQHHIDEQSDEDIEVDFGEDVGSSGCCGHSLVSSKHVVPIDKGEQTLRGHKGVTELEGEQNEPSEMPQ